MKKSFHELLDDALAALDQRLPDIPPEVARRRALNWTQRARLKLRKMSSAKQQLAEIHGLCVTSPWWPEEYEKAENYGYSLR
jgi:hypothetical protein